MTGELAPLLAELWRLPGCKLTGGHGGEAPIHGKDGVGLERLLAVSAVVVPMRSTGPGPWCWATGQMASLPRQEPV